MWKKRDKTGGKTPHLGTKDTLNARKARRHAGFNAVSRQRDGWRAPPLAKGVGGIVDGPSVPRKTRHAGSGAAPGEGAFRKVARDSAKRELRGKTTTRAQWKKDNEFVLCGWNACMRAFEARPQDTCRFYFSKERSLAVNAIKFWCRDHKLPYRELDAESLNKAAGGVHHEGVILVVRPPRAGSLQALTLRGLPPEGFLVALDRVENVHNVGAILRTCAFFGAVGLLVGMEKEPLAVSPSLARVAEGALETVPIYQSADLPSSLRDLRAARTFVLGADLTADRSIYDIEIPFPCVVALGNEQEGLSERVKKRCDAVVSIPGSGTMQSLNVSVAAGVVLAELRRRASMGKPARSGLPAIAP
ncbi:MAG: RNA methyltransferase [Nitrospinae bacterium]|nr:RNA methyltransferase [Nitrospinota bacterium]